MNAPAVERTRERIDNAGQNCAVIFVAGITRRNEVYFFFQDGANEGGKRPLRRDSDRGVDDCTYPRVQLGSNAEYRLNSISLTRHAEGLSRNFLRWVNCVCNLYKPVPVRRGERSLVVRSASGISLGMNNHAPVGGKTSSQTVLRITSDLSGSLDAFVTENTDYDVGGPYRLRSFFRMLLNVDFGGHGL